LFLRVFLGEGGKSDLVKDGVNMRAGTRDLEDGRESKTEGEGEEEWGGGRSDGWMVMMIPYLCTIGDTVRT